MDSVELVKNICKERKIPISRLEKECGFSNGYIRKLKEGKFPTDRIQKISDYLGISLEYLTTGKEPEFDKYGAESAHLVAKIRNDAGLTQALEKYFELSDKKKKHVIELINLLSEVSE